MTYARSMVYAIVGLHASDPIEACSVDDDRLHEALNQVEDDRAHREAEKLRERANRFADSGSDLVADAMAGATRAAADSVDPYEWRDGQLVRKSDGKPVII